MKASRQNRRFLVPTLRVGTHWPRASSRRGVLLLVVLALLAIFGLIGVAFVVLTGQARWSADSMKRVESVADPRQSLLHDAIMQVVHGPATNAAGVPNPASVMGAHSLLEDMYGNGWVSGTLSTLAKPVSGFLLNVSPSALTKSNGAVINGAAIAAEIARRGGCVLTITSVPTTASAQQQSLVGQSTRIVGITPNSSTFQIVAFPNDAPSPAYPPANTVFVINGVPFSGTGFGWSPTSGKFDAARTIGTVTCPLALLPNDTTVNRNPPGGANPEYTAPDFQHVLLAAQVPLQIGLNQWTTQTLPSLQRSALCRYWAKQTEASADFTTASGLATAAGTMSTDLMRAIVLRPLPSDHPNFTGSNPTYQPVDQTVAANLYKTGFNPCWDGAFLPTKFSWDVDNDGDGVPDSVWVDLGFPVRSTADGRLYKPLFAILCVDLDGRLNLNAHGSVAQTDTANYIGTPVSPSGDQITGNPTLASLPRGQGFGPAEINLCPSTLPRLAPIACNHLMLGNTATGIQGRYGSAGVLNPLSVNPVYLNNWFEYGQNYGQNYWDFSNVNNAGSYGSPPDLWGAGAAGLDQAGRPVYSGMKYNGSKYVGFGGVLQNSPYQLNLGANAARGLPSNLGATGPDNPFSPSELEPVLRPYDRDAPSLPARLLALTETTLGDPTTSALLASMTVRKSFTTDSFDVPCPAMISVQTAAGTLSRTYSSSSGGTVSVQHVTDLLAARKIPQAQWAQLLPAEMLVGLKMNINRPFGDGRADDANYPGVVDAPPVLGTTTVAKQVTISGQAVNVSYDGTGTLAANPLQARQFEARYLYVLACLTANTSGIKAQLKTKSLPNPTYDDVARFIAQWAVNVVDFRDRDSIMTRFDYDPKFADPTANLSIGWVDPTDGMHTVWGCERPELLFSEILAFHDRRTEDTNEELVDDREGDSQDTPGKFTDPPTDTPPHKHDASFDQRYRPQGSLFVEFYCPSSPSEPQSGDLYYYDSTSGKWALNLTKVTPTGNSPVWRMVVATPPYVGTTNELLDPDDPDVSKRPVIEREVYFAPDGTATPPALDTGAKLQFFPSAAKNVLVAPGTYAVVGPPGDESNPDFVKNPNRTYIGCKDDGSHTRDDTTRHIDLDKFPLVSVNGDPAVTNAQTPQWLAINMAKTIAGTTGSWRLNVTEPTKGYPATGAKGETFDTATGKYSTPLDIPLDNVLNRADGEAAVLTVDQTVSKYRVIYLQRLANPLVPYDKITNPYRTIDMMPVDMTSFNGFDKNEPGSGTVDGTRNPNIHFQARQRGETNDPSQNNLWRQENLDKDFTKFPDATEITDHVFNFGLKHSLGYLNQPFGLPQATPLPGDPQKPFPWLTWNNRPYVSPLELMQVPWLSSSKLLGTYSLASGNAPYQNPSQPFPHLMNLYMSGPGAAPSEELHRVLEFLGVPSPFLGAEVWASPNAASGSPGAHAYHPPFDAISNCREPGRINLNTIYTQEVFNGLMAGCPGATPTWQDFIKSRSGGTSTNNILAAPDAAVPTEFAHPFRSFGGASMVPAIPALQSTREINATLLREGGTAGTPLFTFASDNDYNNTSRNPYFYYQGVQRLGNLVTTRSNVYAVWITVGYFEVTPAPTGYDPKIYPDGYQLGRELGIDTGETERHRAFYIIDRTLPVGFQRGQDLNAEKAILVNRFIE